MESVPKQAHAYLENRSGVVLAKQWFPERLIDGVVYDQEGSAYVNTHNGAVRLQQGDWVIFRTKGKGRRVRSNEVFVRNFVPLVEGEWPAQDEDASHDPASLGNRDY